MRLVSVFCFLATSVISSATWAQSEELVWVGDWDSYHAYMQVLAAAYEKQTGNQLAIKVKGTSRGIRGVYAGQSDLGGAGRYRIQGLPEEMVVEMLPVAWDPLVVVVHPDNPVSDLSEETLKRIYRGELTNWKAVGGDDRPMKLLARGDDFSGVGYNLRKFLFKDGNVEFPAAELVADDIAIQERVSSDVSSVAVVGLGTAKHAGLKMLRLEGRYPDLSTIKQGEYLFYRISYLVTHPSQNANDAVRGFKRFLQGADGRRALRDAGGLPFLDAPHLKLKEIEQDRQAYAAGFR